MRAHTFDRSIVGSTDSIPKSAAVRMWWATLPEASRALLGTQPVHRQSPPTRLRSTTATFKLEGGGELGRHHPARAHPDDDEVVPVLSAMAVPPGPQARI